MSIKYLPILFLLLMYDSGLAQDLIVTKDGDTMSCTITKVTVKNIVYDKDFYGGLYQSLTFVDTYYWKGEWKTVRQPDTKATQSGQDFIQHLDSSIQFGSIQRTKFAKLTGADRRNNSYFKIVQEDSSGERRTYLPREVIKFFIAQERRSFYSLHINKTDSTKDNFKDYTDGGLSNSKRFIWYPKDIFGELVRVGRINLYTYWIADPQDGSLPYGPRLMYILIDTKKPHSNMFVFNPNALMGPRRRGRLSKFLSDNKTVSDNIKIMGKDFVYRSSDVPKIIDDYNSGF